MPQNAQLPAIDLDINALTPILFKDELVIRGRNNQSVRMGNPYAYLNAIGVEAIIEGFIHGRNVVDVARELNISVIVLLNWISNENHTARIDDAITLSAEGYLSEVGESIKKAQNQFELQKVKELARHNTFLASKVNRKKYGQDVKQASNTGGVTFVMHIGESTHVLATGAQNIPTPPEVQDLEGVFAILPHALPLYKAPDGVTEPYELGPFEPEPFIPATRSMPEYLRPINMSIGGAAPQEPVTTIKGRS